MRVLIFHGYLLRGTGSNVYNANLAAALVELGHEVHLLSQERHAAELDFVGAVGDWDEGTLRVRRVRNVACTVYRPPIGEILPVYVRDRYEGVEARLFPELSEGELRTYLEVNVAATREVVSRCAPTAALANHLIMGPAILARALRARVRYAVTIHGSALEYTVKPHPRFLPYAREGLAPAKGVLVGSRHTAQSLWAALADPSLPARTRLGPPGVDVHRFRPLPRETARAGLAAAAERLRVRAVTAPPSERGSGVEIPSDFERDDAATARALEELADQPPEASLVAFVGKLILAKGVDLALVAWPLVLAEIPQAMLVVAGFGGWREGAQRLLGALSRGELETARELVRAGRGAETNIPSGVAFLHSLERSGEHAKYLKAAATLPGHVLFTGRLEHEELASLLPLCEAIVVPSTFPESFGMVAAEAAACGTLPISARHSGLAEVSRVLAPSLPEPLRGLVSFPLDKDAVRNVASRLSQWLRTPADVRVAVGETLSHAVADRYSWERVARDALCAARGKLGALESPSVVPREA